MPHQVEQIMDRARAVRNLTLAEFAAATPAELTTKPGDRWSALEALIHVGNWEEEGNRYLSYLIKGEQRPAEEQKPIDQWNAEHLAKYAHVDVAGALAYVATTRAELERFAAQITDEMLAANPSFRGLLLMTPDHEIGHLHQMREAIAAAKGETVDAAIHAFRYSRQRVLTRLNLEFRAPEAANWRPAEGKWTIKETLIHLAVWDRIAAGVFAAVADGRPVPVDPVPEGGLDAWNVAQVGARAWMTLADVIAELGAAREEMEAQLRRLTPAQLAASPDATGWLGLRKHDNEHMMKILTIIEQWRKATK